MAGFLSNRVLKGVQTSAFKKQVDKATTKEERRKAEEQHLAPESLPTYKGLKPTNKGIKGRELMLVFRNNEMIALFKKHIGFLEGGGVNSAYKIEAVELLLEGFENGTITMDILRERVASGRETKPVRKVVRR